MQVKRDDLVVATHGRGFWIMDNIAALRQVTPDVAAAPAHLFDIPPAIRRSGGRWFGGRATRSGIQYSGAAGMVSAFEDVRGKDETTRRVYYNAGQNPPPGVAIEYYLKSAPEAEATLAILDARGQVVQQFSSRAKDARRLPAAAGTNRFYWDMRYPNARDVSATSGVQLAAFEASRPMPPVAPPGRYTARLVVSGRTLERPFEIRRDPRWSATDADLQAQFDLMIRIRDRVSEVADTLDRLRETRRKLDEREKSGAGAAGIAPVREKLAAIEVQLTRMVGSHPLEVTPKGIINKLGTLSAVVGSGDSRPTKQAYALFDDLSARFAEQTRLLDEVIAHDAAPLLARPGVTGR